MSLVLAVLVALGQLGEPVLGEPALADLSARACTRDAARGAPTGCCDAPGQQELEAELAFLKRAEAAFLFSHRSTTAVKARIRAVERQLARLAEEPERPEEPEASRPSEEPADTPVEACIAELEADLAFLERAEAAFFHSHRSTTQVKQRIRSVEACLEKLRDR